LGDQVACGLLHAVEDVQFMNTIIFAGQREAQAKVMREPVEDGYALNLALVYQDSETRHWAEDVRDLMAEQAGEGAVQSTAWMASNLQDPASFTRGIQALVEADAIVISLHKADQLPREFYRWVNLWLEVRSGKPGALVALVGTAVEQDSEGMEACQYLQAIARQAGLELFLKECAEADPSTNFEPDDLRPLLKAA
jgi:hypothetical protein